MIEATLREEIHKEPGKKHFIRAVVSYGQEGYSVTTTGPQGSGILRSMVRANGLIVIPEDCEIVRAGEKVKVQMLNSSEL